MKAALLMSHGFNDWNVMPEHSYRIYEAAKENGLPAHDLLSSKWSWWTTTNEHDEPMVYKILHGVDNGVDKASNKGYIVREDDDQTRTYCL